MKIIEEVQFKVDKNRHSISELINYNSNRFDIQYFIKKLEDKNTKLIEMLKKLRK